MERAVLAGQGYPGLYSTPAGWQIGAAGTETPSPPGPPAKPLISFTKKRVIQYQHPHTHIHANLPSEATGRHILPRTGDAEPTALSVKVLDDFKVK